MALRRILDHAVSYSVERVAGSQRGSLDSGQLGRWYVVSLRKLRGPHVRGGRGEQMRPVVGGCAGDDAVVIRGIALRLHQGLTAAI